MEQHNSQVWGIGKGTHPRSTEGLAIAAQQKRAETFAKVDRGIRQLLKARAVINFNSVARAADVSKAWLYKESEVADRIRALKKQSARTQSQREISASEASLKALLKTANLRINTLENERNEAKNKLAICELGLEIKDFWDDFIYREGSANEEPTEKDLAYWHDLHDRLTVLAPGVDKRMSHNGLKRRGQPREETAYIDLIDIASIYF